uniref:Nardilysin a (N-arginine dibasic convertase) n=1 Tax=Denticeps clupeoides TaxID=299321 RepID=A0AAY4BJ43_9TELE
MLLSMKGSCIFIGIFLNKQKNIKNCACYRVTSFLVFCSASVKSLNSLKMNKSKSSADSSTQVSATDDGEPPPNDEAKGLLKHGDPAGCREDLGDPQIIKSPSDPKTYRYVVLSNGLRALLISDLSGPGNVSDDSAGEGEEQGEGDSEEDVNVDEVEDGDDQTESDGGEDQETGDVKKKISSVKQVSLSDNPNSVDFNMLVFNALVIRLLYQSAAALCIGVGSFSDPEDLPGLAHFLEHMVFMGSEKYPAENGFDAFLKRHGGSTNASTDCERTLFQFDVQRKHFREALDRWAQFFICPLMIQDAIEREVEAVDSEYQLAKPSDSHRKEMLFGSLAKPKHPMGHFFWGNAQTLKHEPKELNIDTYQRLQDFWKRHYSAHYMTLAVQSKEKLDTLEKWVGEIFTSVPNNGQAKPDFSQLRDPFDTPAFNKLYRVVPVRKVHALTITWALPPQSKHYRVKPLHYISWLIGHEGTGSILSQLRKRCWALALFGGNSETGFDQNSTYSIFSISITLTDEGFQNFYQVIHMVFQYLKMLQTLGPQQRIYEEIQKIDANEFHYQEQTDPIGFVESICENMQLFPKEDFLTGDQLMFEYEPGVISAALSLMTPEKANLLLLSPQHEGQCPLKEKWFGAQYSVEDIPHEWRDRWTGDFDLNPDLQLPADNKFIATDFTLKTSDCPDTEYPVKIVSNERGCLWFKKDNKFKIPKAYARFNLVSPIIQRCPENLVLFDLLVNVLAHNLAEMAYDADVAQLEYKLIAGEHSLIIRVKGFNHKLPLLLKLIVDYLADFSASPNVFSMFAEQMKKAYFNMLIKPDMLGKDLRLLILEPSRWSLIQKYQALMKGLSVTDLMGFINRLKAELYVEGLVQGNFNSAESKDILQYFIEKLQFKPLTAEAPVHFRVVELPQKQHLCKVRSLNKDDPNSDVTVYYQSGLKNLWEHTMMELLVMHMEEPCFDFLRTKETLGYQVYPTCRNTSGILGFSVTVETQATKFPTDFVETKIEEFLQSFGETLASLSDEAFQAQVSALIKLKECEDPHLGEEVDRNWFEVVTQQYVFDRIQKEIEALKTMKKENLLSWFMDHRQANRRLSVHVVGFGQAEEQLTFMPASPLLAEATKITDIHAFTSSLSLFPYHKILK